MFVLACIFIAVFILPALVKGFLVNMERRQNASYAPQRATPYTARQVPAYTPRPVAVLRQANAEIIIVGTSCRVFLDFGSQTVSITNQNGGGAFFAAELMPSEVRYYADDVTSTDTDYQTIEANGVRLERGHSHTETRKVVTGAYIVLALGDPDFEPVELPFQDVGYAENSCKLLNLIRKEALYTPNEDTKAVMRLNGIVC